YWVLRQMYYHRSDCFHFVAAAMRRAGRAGDFCEYGCGVAPITAWLRPRFPGWRYTLVDLPSPTLDFARWRFRRFANVEAREPGLGADLPLTRDYDAIACLEVLEHVINPLEVVRHLVAHLKPGRASGSARARAGSSRPRSAPPEPGLRHRRLQRGCRGGRRPRLGRGRRSRRGGHRGGPRGGRADRPRRGRIAALPRWGLRRRLL